MSSPNIIPSTSPVGTSPANTNFQLMSEGKVSFGSTNKPSSSLRKLIRKSRYQRKFKMKATIVSTENTTVEGLIVMVPSPTIEELLSGPLFQVAGIFEIDEPGWADKHDEYIAETYL
jgi:hypothetical protein